RRNKKGGRKGLAGNQGKKRRKKATAGEGTGAARRDQPRRQPRVRAPRLRADEDQHCAAEQAATDRPQRRHERGAQLRIAERSVAVTQRKRPTRLQHMRTGRRSPERADEDEDRET